MTCNKRTHMYINVGKIFHSFSVSRIFFPFTYSISKSVAKSVLFYVICVKLDKIWETWWKKQMLFELPLHWKQNIDLKDTKLDLMFTAGRQAIIKWTHDRNKVRRVRWILILTSLSHATFVVTVLVYKRKGRGGYWLRMSRCSSYISLWTQRCNTKK